MGVIRMSEKIRGEKRKKILEIIKKSKMISLSRD